jgi:hypothetical protein
VLVEKEKGWWMMGGKEGWLEDNHGIYPTQARNRLSSSSCLCKSGAPPVMHTPLSTSDITSICREAASALSNIETEKPQKQHQKAFHRRRG